MKKVHVFDEGKTFEAYLQMLMTEDEKIIGMAYSGNISACRAIHASLYFYGTRICIYDDETGETRWYDSSQSYRRIEVVNGKVCHTFLLPRSAIHKDYEEEFQKVEQRVEPNQEKDVYKPERIIIAPANRINFEIGMFLADVFGLPKTRDWVETYFSLLPPHKYDEINIETTELMAEEWKDMKAIRINPMTENEMLGFVELGIKNKLLNVRTDITTNAVFRQGMTTEEYLRENAETLAAHLNKYMKPKYDGTHFVRAIGETKRVCLPAQARAVMGVLTAFKEMNSGFLCGALGTGKTQMALTTAYALMKQREQSGANDGLRVLIVAPAIIVPKWATSEIPTILGRDVAKVTVINSTEDALKYVRKVQNGHKVKKGTIEFVLVSTDRMKLGANKYVLGAIWDYKNQVWKCPDCGKPIISPNATKEEPDLLASWSDAVDEPIVPPSQKEIKKAIAEKRLLPNGTPKGYIQKWSNKIRRFICYHCSDVTQTDEKGLNKKVKNKNILARPALRSKGEDRVQPRWMIAQIFQRKLRNHFHLGIYDEIQMFKANDSGRGLSFHKLLKSTRKNLFLTGTLTNGEAISIKATLWRSDPKSLLEEGFNHNTSDIVWAKKYGVLEKVTFRKDDGVIGVTTNRRQEKVILRSKPGISPRLTANHLLHKSVFLELSDLGLPLVKKEEIPVIVPLKDDHAIAYKEFHEQLYETCKQLQEEIGTAAWAKFNSATLNYADQPHIEQSIDFYSKDGEYLGNVTAQPFDKNYLTAKEERLIEIIQKELAENRGCIIYTNFTGKYKQNERLQKVLKRFGIESEILDTKVSGEKRFEWLERQKKKGTKVLIMNMSLVQVGLDLLEWATIIFYQLNDDLNVLRQAGGRNWRIGQNRNVKIYYLVNENTTQMTQFQRLMTRRIEALLVEGRISRSDELAKFAEENESKLARDLSFSLEASELEEKWKTAAEKDVDQNIEMIDEKELQQKIKQAFKKLTNETKRLCGVPIEERKVIEFPNQKQETQETPKEPVQMDIFSLPEYLEAEIIPLKKKKKGKTTQKQEEKIVQITFNLF